MTEQVTKSSGSDSQKKEKITTHTIVKSSISVLLSMYLDAATSCTYRIGAQGRKINQIRSTI